MDKYRAIKIDDATYYVENGEVSEYVRSAHCKCCALANMILMHGGQADLRGLHRYGICY